MTRSGINPLPGWKLDNGIRYKRIQYNESPFVNELAPDRRMSISAAADNIDIGVTGIPLWTPELGC